MSPPLMNKFAKRMSPALHRSPSFICGSLNRDMLNLLDRSAFPSRGWPSGAASPSSKSGATLTLETTAVRDDCHPGGVGPQSPSLSAFDIWKTESSEFVKNLQEAPQKQLTNACAHRQRHVPRDLSQPPRQRGHGHHAVGRLRHPDQGPQLVLAFHSNILSLDNAFDHPQNIRVDLLSFIYKACLADEGCLQTRFLGDAIREGP